MPPVPPVPPVPPLPVVAPEPLVVAVVLEVEVVPPQEMSPAARMRVSVMTAKLRARTDALNTRRRVTIKRAAVTSPNIRAPMIHAVGPDSGGKLCSCRVQMNAGVGVALRWICNVVVVVCAGLIWPGVKLQASQFGSHAPVSAFRHENETVPAKLLWFTVTLKLALGLAAVKVAEVGETEPGEFVVVTFRDSWRR